MKKFLLFFLTAFLAVSVHSQKSDTEYFDIKTSLRYSFENIYITPERIYIAGKSGSDYKNYVADRKNFYIGEDGWYHFFNFIVLLKADGVSRFCMGTKLNLKFHVNKNGRVHSDEWLCEYNEEEKKYVNDYSPAKFTASSRLKEKIKGKEVVYSESDLMGWVKGPDHDCWVMEDEWLYPDADHKPWVPAGGKKGTGETLKVNFEKPINEITILNGYVDFYHPDYYKKNSRVKNFIIYDEDNDKSYSFTFKDIVQEQMFVLNQSTKNIVFKIQDVYEGSKYSDICITGFAGRENSEIYNYDEEDERSGKAKDYLSRLRKKTRERIISETEDLKIDGRLEQYDFFTGDEWWLFEYDLANKYPEFYNHENIPAVDIVVTDTIKISESSDFVSFLIYKSSKKVSYVKASSTGIYPYSEIIKPAVIKRRVSKNEYVPEDTLDLSKSECIFNDNFKIEIVYEDGSQEFIDFNKEQLEKFHKYLEHAICYHYDK